MFLTLTTRKIKGRVLEVVLLHFLEVYSENLQIECIIKSRSIDDLNSLIHKIRQDAEI